MALNREQLVFQAQQDNAGFRIIEAGIIVDSGEQFDAQRDRLIARYEPEDDDNMRICFIQYPDLPSPSSVEVLVLRKEN